MNVEELLEKYEDEYLAYSRDDSLSMIVHDFYIFSKLVPFVKRGDLVKAADSYEIYLDVDADEVVNTLSEEDMVKLIRCGLRYSSDHECFVMFV